MAPNDLPSFVQMVGQELILIHRERRRGRYILWQRPAYGPGGGHGLLESTLWQYCFLKNSEEKVINIGGCCIGRTTDAQHVGLSSAFFIISAKWWRLSFNIFAQ